MTGLMRKHGKTLLTIFSCVLMLIFVLPNFRGSGEAGDMERGRLNGKKIVNREVTAAGGDLQILRMIGLCYRNYVIVDMNLPIVLDANENNQSLHWFLLVHEAATYGMSPNPGEVDSIISSLTGRDPDFATTIAQKNLVMRDVQGAIGRALMVHQLMVTAVASCPVSLPEVEYRADLDLTKIHIAFATLDTKDWAQAPAPTEEQIKNQFEAYKDIVAPAPDVTPTAAVAGHVYPFGYKYPDRVKVEYLRFDREAVTNQLKPTSEDYDAAYRYYKDHQSLERFQNPQEHTMALSTQPAIKPFDQVKAELVKDQIALRVSALLKKAADRALAMASDPWKNAGDDNGYHMPIPENQWASYQKIAEQIASNKDFNPVRPEYGATPASLGAVQLAALPGIGEAYLDKGKAGQIPFATLATHVKELVGTKDQSVGGAFLQVGAEAPLITDAKGNVYLYRVTAADQSHQPPALDDTLRAQVIEDLKKVATYQKRQAEAKDLAAAARTGDLLALARDKNIPAGSVPDKNLLPGSTDLKELTRTTQIIPQLGDKAVPGFVDAAFSLTSDPAATQPMQHIDPTTTLARDETLKIYVLALTDFQPASPVDFARSRAQIARESNRQPCREFLETWLNIQAVANRVKFVPAARYPLSSKPGDEG